MIAALIPLHGADCCKDAVALVIAVSGRATAHPSGAAGAQLNPFDWLPQNSIVEVGTGASATLVLLNGHQYQLGAGVKATVTANGLMPVSPKIQELPPLTPLPKPAPIADRGTTSGAVRFRSPNDIHNLYPRAGTFALPSRAKLQFSAVQGASAYEVTLEEDGDAILTLRESSTSLTIPGDLLKAGTNYSWRVRAIGESGVLAEAAADFATISQAGLQVRAAFEDALKSLDEASRLALLGAVDLRLGLLAEASDEFRAAQRLKPDDPALRRAADLAGKALEEPTR